MVAVQRSSKSAKSKPARPGRRSGTRRPLVRPGQEWRTARLPPGRGPGARARLAGRARPGGRPSPIRNSIGAPPCQSHSSSPRTRCHADSWPAGSRYRIAVARARSAGHPARASQRGAVGLPEEAAFRMGPEPPALHRRRDVHPVGCVHALPDARPGPGMPGRPRPARPRKRPGTWGVRRAGSRAVIRPVRPGPAGSRTGRSVRSSGDGGCYGCGSGCTACGPARGPTAGTGSAGSGRRRWSR